MQPRHLSVTVMDVAKLAGVSAMTVSRVFNAPHSVNAKTLARVQAAVASTGYVPNRGAGGLRSARTRLVSAVVPTLSGPVFLDTIEALNSRLQQHGYQLMVGQSGYSTSTEDDLVRDIIGRRPDGIVLTGVVHSEPGRQRLLAAGIPIVETWDVALDPIDMLVGFSHEAVGRSVAEYLLQKGRRRLALIGGDDPRSVRRAEAFTAMAQAQGAVAPIVHLVPAPTKLSDGRRALRSILQSNLSVDGVFCSSDMLALGVLTEARAAGLGVPADLSVVGFGDLNFAADLDPALTTVRIDGRRIGQIAADCIVERAAGRRPPELIVDVGFTIVRRASA
ncbi:LacI family DNA-binding transcriptional regulator [Variovorax paradoxus]|uniref:LacI family DNA-binding transcriptional regulator n=1 Tax=Variovorax paradoxus TaxID=34073 RepID=UPI00285F8226|nr:LacI family DNA-binding transcriptional regulator [Variovorax paradoxus]MDR6456528.1 LacI family gluconate utilization system Gnt-I transcriptional repressor [Variovorax paradoxus]